MPKLIKNKAKCANCGDVIESKHRHDFVVCSCYVDSDNKIKEYKANNIWELPKEKWGGPSGCWTPEFKEFIGNLHGIAIDGGKAYRKCCFFNIKDVLDLSEYEEDENECTK